MPGAALPPTATSTEARRERFASGLRAVAFGVVSNAALIVLKGVAGILGHSQGLIADAAHSGADLVNSLAALVSLLISRRPGDRRHPYGHGRAEAQAANFAAFVVGAAGVLVGWEALRTLRARTAATPDLLTLWVAITVVKLARALRTRCGPPDAQPGGQRRCA